MKITSIGATVTRKVQTKQYESFDCTFHLTGELEGADPGDTLLLAEATALVAMVEAHGEDFLAGVPLTEAQKGLIEMVAEERSTNE